MKNEVSDSTEICSGRSPDLGAYMYICVSFRSIAAAVTKHAMIMDDNRHRVIVRAHSCEQNTSFIMDMESPDV
jgi:hypothetical protein